ncbi:peptidogalycan biosysnthesis protein [Pleomorphomonas oryzae]|uniref:peptidogalycan biosysnthesis protein n=1 Tax=Pleomorphomonas oryzae TaxID=261934 RepID=UPI0004160161|nr:GNAT family N-acetyltransferase [Pleomorphomonas oryzae]
MPPDALLRPVTWAEEAEFDVCSDLGSIDRQQWNACFPGEVEGYDYLLAVERAGIPGFEFRYVIGRAGGKIVAAMPAFLTRYGLETTLDSRHLRDVVMRLRGVWSNFLMLPLACLGSPCTEIGYPGFDPDIPAVCRADLFQGLVETFESHARTAGCVLLALKDIPKPLPDRLMDVIAGRGYAELAGLPTAVLDIDFPDLDGYFARLSAATRKDLRRKLKARQNVRIERRSDLGPYRDRAMELYRQTRERSDWQFEDLTLAYFEGMLARMPGQSFVTMYFVGDELLATNFLIRNERTLIDKFFCMDAEKGRLFNLYYLSWIDNVEYCLKEGLSRYQSGQAYYENKVRLGSRLGANSMFFRHTNALTQRALRFAAPYLAIATPGEERSEAG